jgi:protein-S-isoprenylcysteine O-methyltransferase Ste14
MKRFPQGLFLILIAAALGAHWWLAWPLPAVPYRIWTGAGLIVFALLIIGWAILEMRAKGTSPLPWEDTTALVQYGPYRFSRNPIYLADLLIMAGLALVLGTTWLLVAAAMAVPLTRWLVIHHEEADLAALFGDTWKAYAEKVRRWI